MLRGWTKHEEKMVATLEDLFRQFEGFQPMMKQSRDKLSTLDARRGAVDESMGSLLSKIDDTAAQLLWLELHHLHPLHRAVGSATSTSPRSSPIGTRICIAKRITPWAWQISSPPGCWRWRPRTLATPGQRYIA
jgi:hypothetical protein